MHLVLPAVAPKKLRLWFAIALSIILFSAADLWAANIKAVQGKKVLLDLSGDAAVEGDLFIAMSPQGKKLGIIRLQKVRGGKAIGQLVKGRAEKGWDAVARGGTASHKASKSKGSRKVTPSTSELTLGGLGGISMDTQNVTILNTQVAMTGMGFSGSAFGDYFFTESLSLRGIAGLETFNAAGSISVANCTGTTDCQTKIMYLNGGGLARWTFVTGDVAVWAGGGAYFLMPMTKSSNAIKEDSIKMTYVLTVAGGADIRLNHDMFIPVQLEYGMFPATDDVETKWINIRAGLGWYF